MLQNLNLDLESLNNIALNISEIHYWKIKNDILNFFIKKKKKLNVAFLYLDHYNSSNHSLYLKKADEAETLRRTTRYL